MESQNNKRSSTPITNFYKGKSILLTGATGFLGGVVLHKLLYSCSDIKCIYTLVKSKKGMSGQERLNQLLNSTIFQSIHNENPELIKKVILVSGDMTDYNLGLSAEDTELLRREVSVVFHVAASVNFSLPLLDIVNVNTRATEKMLRLAKTMDHLQAFVYVSTAYSNCRQSNDVIDEVVYNMTTSVQSAYYAVEHVSPTSDLLNNLMDRRPNSYTYSKALTELLIEREFNEMPVAIVRPTIITSAMKEPVAGWVQGWNAGNNVVLLQGIGVMRVWHGDANAAIDIIPVDIVANLIVAAAWDISKNNIKDQSKVKVFNCSTSLQNPLSLRQLLYTSSTYSKVYYDHLIPPSIILIKNPVLFSIIFFFLQVIPAYIIKGLCAVFGRKSRMEQMYGTVPKMAACLPFFSVNQFTFIDKNTKQLYMDMDENDKRIFYTDVKMIDWYSYIETYVIGLKKYLLK